MKIIENRLERHNYNKNHQIKKYKYINSIKINYENTQNIF